MNIFFFWKVLQPPEVLYNLFKINRNPDLNCLLLFFFPAKMMIVRFDASKVT